MHEGEQLVLLLLSLPEAAHHAPYLPSIVPTAARKLRLLFLRVCNLDLTLALRAGFVGLLSFALFTRYRRWGNVAAVVRVCCGFSGSCYFWFQRVAEDRLNVREVLLFFYYRDRYLVCGLDAGCFCFFCLFFTPGDSQDRDKVTSLRCFRDFNWYNDELIPRVL